jgi:hypothetical protein
VIATSYEITGRKQFDPISFANMNDFELSEGGNIDADAILNNPYITLYSLDFEKKMAVFVETPSDVNLSQAPFYYQMQRSKATRVVTTSFETMIELGQHVPVDDEKLVLIHSMGRSGSTLASQLFAQVDGVINMSEPDALTLLVAIRSTQPDAQDMTKALVNASIRLLCKTPAETAWVIKGRSWVIELGDWLHESFPKTRNVYLYRDAVSWSKSSLGAFLDTVERTPEELYQFENETRDWMKLFMPLIASHDPNEHLSATGLLSLMWLSNMERYMELHKSGVEMLAIPYSSWSLDPGKTAVSMLEYCCCLPADMTAIDETLKKDSQAGTSLSQQTVKKKTTGNKLFDMDELNQVLQNHAYIKPPVYEVANTLNL